MSFLLAVSISFKAEEIIGIIFGSKYLQAYLPMILLLIVQIFLFNNFFTINLLTVYNKQRKTIVYALVIVIVNLIANIILIPLFSYTGAGYAKLISIVAGSFVLFLVIKKIKLNYNFFSLQVLSWIIIIPAVLFALSYLDLLFYIVISLVLIAYLTLKLKYFNNEELLMILKLVDKEKWSEKLLKI
jgi:O-antigen/teichoic acid export membrane protein